MKLSVPRTRFEMLTHSKAAGSSHACQRGAPAIFLVKLRVRKIPAAASALRSTNPRPRSAGFRAAIGRREQQIRPSADRPKRGERVDAEFVATTTLSGPAAG